MPNYVVLGGTGFLGSHLVAELVSEGHKVRVVARQPPKSPSLLPPQVEFVQGSITDRDALFRATEGANGIFHLSGVVEHTRRDTGSTIEDVHVDGTSNVLQAAERANARVIYASTSGTVAVSHDSNYIAHDDAPYAENITAKWPYYRTKIQAEKKARGIAAEKGVELICMRPSLLLGPGDARLSSTRSVFDLMRGKIPIMPQGGLNFVDVRDAADAFATAMTRGTAGSTYLVGGPNMTFEEYFKRISELSGAGVPFLRVPPSLAVAVSSLASRALGLVGKWDPSLDPVVVEMSAAFWYLDASRAREELGLNPRDATETLRDTVEWIRRHEEGLRRL